MQRPGSDDGSDDDGISDLSQQEEREVEKISRQETKNVRGCRFAIFAVQLVACLLISIFTFQRLQTVENDLHEQTYTNFIQTMQDLTEIRVTTLRKTMQGLAEEISAQAKAEDAEFPFVTLPSFEVPAGHARKVSGVVSILYAPLVQDEQAWLDYARANTAWVNMSRAIVSAESSNTEKHGHSHGESGHSTHPDDSHADHGEDIQQHEENHFMMEPIHAIEPGIRGDYVIVPFSGQNPDFPLWQSSPPPDHLRRFFNLNLQSLPVTASIIKKLMELKEPIFAPFENPEEDTIHSDIFLEDIHSGHHDAIVNLEDNSFAKHLHSSLMQPVLDGDKLVGLMTASVSWDAFFANLLPKGVEGITAVFSNSCDSVVHTYTIIGDRARYEGRGDLHERAFSDTLQEISISGDFGGFCELKFQFYASSKFQADDEGVRAITFPIAIAIVFGVMTISFLLYDFLVRRKNEKVVQNALQSDAILSSLFPSNVRDRLVAGENKKGGQPQSRLQSFLTSGEMAKEGNTKTGKEQSRGSDVIAFKGKPIADLFPDTTIMFADISGFTAWSSVREPSQVFTLLETLYHSFDEIARRRRVFKVETVGDCYVAVTGLPEPQKDHAVIMSRFARDCLAKTQQLTKKLEVLLGPDTGDLAMRIGLHSGPVTAGVLRGERSRFQLFGDTMNTASRMESTGLPNNIQISQETADMLVASGKGDWFYPREEKVVAKGKGELQTFWLQPAARGGAASSYQSDEDPSNNKAQELDNEIIGATLNTFDAKTTRLIDWNVDVMVRLLKHIVARRQVRVAENSTAPDESVFMRRGQTVLEEVKEIIKLPKFDAQAAVAQDNINMVELSDDVVSQLHSFVSSIAAIYRDNPFHNFEHASHVTMSVTKLLSRIVAPSEFDFSAGKHKIASTLHDHTYGITSDPLTQFACVVSALIHDADHSGVPNAQLVKENSRIAEFYKGKSVAEQNSVDLSWDLLMDPIYEDLRHTIYTTNEELKRFRQLVVNSVMATDIVDKELKTLRNNRWDRAFSGAATEEDVDIDRNRKATIVIEHLIQASDVAHTMQHWHIYRKWNERLFIEAYEAFKSGRAENDPIPGWYRGEIGFFDFYIIPLAKKLKNCGVFGVSSDEYLNYAIKNREEWESRGHGIVDEMVDKFCN